MKKLIPQYTFFENKYGSKLLVDVVELKYVKKFLNKHPIHSLTYYDITFIIEGEGDFFIDNQKERAAPGDVFFSKPGEIRNWDINHIVSGYALIFEDDFLSSFIKDPLFVQHLSFFNMEKTSVKLHLSADISVRIIQLLQDIKTEIDSYKRNGIYVLRALLYEILMLLDRAYQDVAFEEDTGKKANNLYISKFIKLVGADLKEQHDVRYYAYKLCITSNYLNEIVNSAIKISPKQYIQNKLMDEAKRLLVYTDASISEIAYELHFSTVSYFIRWFRQCTGNTPLLYRKIHKP